VIDIRNLADTAARRRPAGAPDSLVLTLN